MLRGRVLRKSRSAKGRDFSPESAKDGFSVEYQYKNALHNRYVMGTQQP